MAFEYLNQVAMLLTACISNNSNGQSAIMLQLTVLHNKLSEAQIIGPLPLATATCAICQCITILSHNNGQWICHYRWKQALVLNIFGINVTAAKHTLQTVSSTTVAAAALLCMI